MQAVEVHADSGASKCDSFRFEAEALFLALYAR